MPVIFFLLKSKLFYSRDVEIKGGGVMMVLWPSAPPLPATQPPCVVATGGSESFCFFVFLLREQIGEISTVLLRAPAEVTTILFSDVCLGRSGIFRCRVSPALVWW
jgi:hypothetical protein